MSKRIATLLLPIVLAGCATRNTSTNWTCMPEGDHCSSIAETDTRKDLAAQRKGTGVIFDAKPARWWEPNAPGIVTREFDPRRDGDQVMRVVIAPFVDAQGDYHARSEIFAVVRKAQWWLSPPVSEASAPKAGTRLDGPDQTAGDEK